MSLVSVIDNQECIGDSLNTINLNFLNLDRQVTTFSEIRTWVMNNSAFETQAVTWVANHSGAAGFQIPTEVRDATTWVTTNSAGVGDTRAWVSSHSADLQNAISNSSANLAFVYIPTQYSIVSTPNSSNLDNASTFTSILGGVHNTITSSHYSVLVGGNGNSISTGERNTIVGGASNCLSGTDNFIGGGASNISRIGSYNAIMGGNSNSVLNGDNCVLIGGSTNTINSGDYNTSIGGYNNNITGTYNIVGGSNNTVNADYSSVLCGTANSTTGSYSVVLNGNNNTLAGNHSIIAGINNKSDYANTYTFGTKITAIQADATYINNLIFVGNYQGVATYYDFAAHHPPGVLPARKQVFTNQVVVGSITLNHDLSTQDIMIQCFNASNVVVAPTTVATTTTSTVTIAIANGTYKIVLIG